VAGSGARPARSYLCLGDPIPDPDQAGSPGESAPPRLARETRVSCMGCDLPRPASALSGSPEGDQRDRATVGIGGVPLPGTPTGEIGGGVFPGNAVPVGRDVAGLADEHLWPVGRAPAGAGSGRARARRPCGCRPRELRPSRMRTTGPGSCREPVAGCPPGSRTPRGGNRPLRTCRRPRRPPPTPPPPAARRRGPRSAAEPAPCAARWSSRAATRRARATVLLLAPSRAGLRRARL
jgi:hypothetical protein